MGADRARHINEAPLNSGPWVSRFAMSVVSRYEKSCVISGKNDKTPPSKINNKWKFVDSNIIIAVVIIVILQSNPNPEFNLIPNPESRIPNPESRIQSNPIQSNPIQSNPESRIQSNPIQSNPIQSNPIQSNPIQSNPIQVSGDGCVPSFLQHLENFNLLYDRK